MCHHLRACLKAAKRAGFSAMPATSEAELKAILESLDNRKQAWAALGAAERAALLRETLKTTSAVSLPTPCHKYAEPLSH